MRKPRRSPFWHQWEVQATQALGRVWKSSPLALSEYSKKPSWPPFPALWSPFWTCLGACPAPRRNPHHVGDPTFPTLLALVWYHQPWPPHQIWGGIPSGLHRMTTREGDFLFSWNQQVRLIFQVIPTYNDCAMSQILPTALCPEVKYDS